MAVTHQPLQEFFEMHLGPPGKGIFQIIPVES